MTAEVLRFINVILLLLVFSLLSTTFPSQAQSVSRKSNKSKIKPVSAPDNSEKTHRQISRLAENALSLRNVELRVRTVVGLADLYWKYDEKYGRQLFLKAFDVLKSTQPTESGALAAPEDTTAAMPTVTKNKLISLYVRFFAHLAKHDSELQQKLFRDSQIDLLATLDLGRSMELSAASMLLLENDSKAFDFISKGIGGGIGGHLSSMQFLDLLMRSRVQDEQRADQLFVQVLDQLASQGTTSADDLLTIGNYLFTSPQSLAGDYGNKTVVSPVFVGRIAFHADISVDRPGIQPPIVQKYLRTAVNILSRPNADDAVNLQNRAAAFLLLPKARRFAPELLAAFGALASGLEGSRTNSTEAGNTEPAPASVPDLETVMATLEKIKDPNRQNEYCLRMIALFYVREDFKSARTLTDKLPLLSTREQLLDLISLREAVVAFQSGNLSLATLRARKLTPSPARSFLWFAIARTLIQKKDLPAARAAIDEGLEDARRTDGSTRASLLLLAAELVGKFNSSEGTGVFDEALKALMAIDSNSNDPLRFDRVVRIKMGSQSVIFNTNVKGINPGSLGGAVGPLLARDPEGMPFSLLQLPNEHLRSSAILALASAALD